MKYLSIRRTFKWRLPTSESKLYVTKNEYLEQLKLDIPRLFLLVHKST